MEGAKRVLHSIPAIAERAVYSAVRTGFVAVSRAAEFIFDRRWGIRTRGAVHNDAQVGAQSIGGDANEYEPANLLLWWRMERAIPAVRTRTTFVDLGAGLGRPAILAAHRGYRRVVAVELDVDLVRQAEDNIRQVRSRQRPFRRWVADVVVIHGDAAAYELPPGPLVICVYNSFGPVTLRRVLGQLCGAPRDPESDPVFLAYLNPVHADVVEEFSQLVLHSRGKRWAVYRLTDRPTTHQVQPRRRRTPATRGRRPTWASRAVQRAFFAAASLAPGQAVQAVGGEASQQSRRARG